MKTDLFQSCSHCCAVLLCLVSQLCLLFTTPCSVACQAPLSMGILQGRIRSGLPCPPPGDLPTQGSNPGLPHCRWILYQLSHKGSLRILEWVAYPFSRVSSRPSNQTGVFSNAGGFFTNCAIKEAIYDRLFSELCFHIAS